MSLARAAAAAAAAAGTATAAAPLVTNNSFSPPVSHAPTPCAARSPACSLLAVHVDAAVPGQRPCFVRLVAWCVELFFPCAFFFSAEPSAWRFCVVSGCCSMVFRERTDGFMLALDGPTGNSLTYVSRDLSDIRGFAQRGLSGCLE